MRQVWLDNIRLRPENLRDTWSQTWLAADFRKFQNENAKIQQSTKV